MIEGQLSKTSMVVARSMRFGRDAGGSDGVRGFGPGIAGRIVGGSIDREADGDAAGGRPVSALAIEAFAPSEIRCVAGA